MRSNFGRVHTNGLRKRLQPTQLNPCQINFKYKCKGLRVDTAGPMQLNSVLFLCNVHSTTISMIQRGGGGWYTIKSVYSASIPHPPSNRNARISPHSFILPTYNQPMAPFVYFVLELFASQHLYYISLRSKHARKHPTYYFGKPI